MARWVSSWVVLVDSTVIFRMPSFYTCRIKCTLRITHAHIGCRIVAQEDLTHPVGARDYLYLDFSKDRMGLCIFPNHYMFSYHIWEFESLKFSKYQKLQLPFWKLRTRTKNKPKWQKNEPKINQNLFQKQPRECKRAPKVDSSRNQTRSLKTDLKPLEKHKKRVQINLPKVHNHIVFNPDLSQPSARPQPDLSETSARPQRDLRPTPARPQPDLSQTSARSQPDLSQTSSEIQPVLSRTSARPQQVFGPADCAKRLQ